MMPVKIALLGLGGVGGYFGAKLCRTFSGDPGANVIFLARESTAEVIRKNGIRLITPHEEFVAYPHRVSSDGNEVGPVDFLICSVKSYDLESSLAQFRVCIGAHTIILPLQNGIDAAERVKKLFPQNEVWNGCVYIVARRVEAGVIRESGNIHSLYFGSRNADKVKSELLFSLLKKSHDDVFLETDIENVVWQKFIFISTLASLTSYLDVCIGKILEQQSGRDRLEKMLQEITAVAKAEKITLPSGLIPGVISKMESLPYETTSSMHSDFKAGNKTEIQSLTEHVISLADRHHLEVPVYREILRGLRIRNNA